MTAMRSISAPQLPHFVAVAAAEIAVVELPYKGWGELVPFLMENVNAGNADEKIKIASLQCLGYVCDRLVDVEELVGSIPELDTEIVDQMLTLIVNAVQPEWPDERRFAALNALKNSLLFIRKNMDNKQERDFIMKAIAESCRSQQSKIKSLAFGCLDTIAEFYYEVLQDYMTNIYQLTTDAIQQDNEDEVKMAAIEVWNTLSEMENGLIDEEKEAAASQMPLNGRAPCPRYVQAAMEPLIPLLLNLLTQQNEDDTNEDQNLQTSAATCLGSISLTVEGLIVPHVVPYVQKYIQSSEWRFRDAAIIAFMSILEGPSTAEVGQYVEQSIEVMLHSFNDENNVVRGSAVHCVRKICSHHLDRLGPDRLNAILNAVDQKLVDRPSIAAPACSAIFDICQGLKQVPPPQTNILSQGMVHLMQNLLKVADRQDGAEHNLRVTAMSAASEVIQAAALDVNAVFVELLPFIVSKLESTLTSSSMLSNEEKEDRAQVVGQLAALIQTLYQRMQKDNVLSQTDHVMTVLLNALQVRNAAEEVFLAISAVAANLEQDFQKYMDAYVPPLLQGLSSLELTNLCIICTGSVVDLCAGLGSLIQPYADAIMEALFNIIRDVSVHRDVKPVVISSFGDVAMAVGAAYQPYMQLTMMLLMQASQQQVPDDNDDMVIFINKLRCSVLEAYSGILVGLAEGGAVDIFVPSLPNIFGFLTLLAGDPTKDDEVLQKSVTLLGDLAHELGSKQELKQHVNQPTAAQLIREGLANHNENIRLDSQWARDELQKAAQTS